MRYRGVVPWRRVYGDDAESALNGRAYESCIGRMRTRMKGGRRTWPAPSVFPFRVSVR